jgi:hypothetical protein
MIDSNQYPEKSMPLKSAAPRWRKQEINVAVHDGGQNLLRTVPALVYGQLAVHRAISLDAWSITHTVSGLTLCFRPKQAQAKQLAVELLQLPVCWSFQTEAALSLEDREAIKTYICAHSGLHAYKEKL